MSTAPGRIEVTFSQTNLVEAYRFHCARRWDTRTYLHMGAIFAVILFVILASKEGFGDAKSLLASGLISLVVAALLCGAIMLANRYFGASQVRDMMKGLNLEGAVSIFDYDHEGLTITDRMFGGRMQWDEAHGWTRNDKVLLIYRTPQFYYYLARDDVEPRELENLVSIMQAAGVREI